MKTIEQTAQRCREKVMEGNNDLFAEMHEKLRQLTEQIRQLDEDNDFNECDLTRLNNTLLAIRRQWTGPSAICVQHHSQEFVRKIDVVSATRRWNRSD